VNIACIAVVFLGQGEEEGKEKKGGGRGREEKGISSPLLTFLPIFHKQRTLAMQAKTNID
jgi:hypothetical protein